jgi:TonB family protein
MAIPIRLVSIVRRFEYTVDALKHALKRKFSGTVGLEVTIDPAGHAKDITVKVSLPFGLTQQAIETVKRWRLKPVIGPDGKPASARQVVELSVFCS